MKKNITEMFLCSPWYALVVAFLLLIGGCRVSDIGLEPSSLENTLVEEVNNPILSHKLSYRVKNYLIQESLLNEYRATPIKLIHKLNRKFYKNHNQDVLLALIEMTYMEGLKREGIKALYYYLSCTVYCAAYFQKDKLTPPPSPYSPRFIYVCMFYNFSTGKIIDLMQNEKYNLTRKRDFPIVQGKLILNPAKSSLPLSFKSYKEFIPCYKFKSYGFLTSATTYGMGIPLIALPDVDYNIANSVKLGKNIYGVYNAPAPTTLFLRVKEDNSKLFSGVLEFYNPYRETTLNMTGNKAPLETDITTPLAYMSKKGPAYSGLSALANPKYMHISEGLYFLTPYDKNKIPLVIVHGLMSRPRTWIQMVNTLMNNQEIREHYQLWFFAYPTGFPVLVSASKLRTALKKAKKILNPDGKDHDFNKMVLIGHSMGGLLVRSMVQNPGDAIEKILFSEPVDKLDVKPEIKEQIKKAIFFKPLPFVSEVIFMSTPHRGSMMTHWTSLRLAMKLITLPKDIVHTLSEIGKTRHLKQGLLGENKSIVALNGVDGLDPTNKVMQYLVNVPITVKYHSIIGNNEQAGEVGGSDGVVSYRSSHLDGAASETIVKSGHNVQQTTAGIKAVRKILLEHLKNTK